jgi:hypothetical protein
MAEIRQIVRDGVLMPQPSLEYEALRAAQEKVIEVRYETITAHFPDIEDDFVAKNNLIELLHDYEVRLAKLGMLSIENWKKEE